MQALREILLEMEEVLDRLIENARKLHELSKQVIVEDEVDMLQKEQNEMLTKLTELDDKRASTHTSEEFADKSIRSHIDEKIDVFQELNARFIENLSSTRGLIHFEDDKLKKNPNSKK